MTQISSELISLARPYAKAAFAFALEHKDISAWTDMLQYTSQIVTDPAVAGLLQNPRVNREQELELVLSLSTKMLDDNRRRFLELLTQNKRLAALPAIASMFATLRAEHEHIIYVKVDTAFPFNKQKEESLLQALKIRLQRNIVLEFRIDESLIGGAIIRADDLVIDGSVRGQLAELEKALEN
ncbi:F0F1 ATP synthase subunit delta [soil metagenome]